MAVKITLIICLTLIALCAMDKLGGKKNEKNDEQK